MWSLTRLRQTQLFGPLFAHVHPLCWPILWWELNRLIRWFLATKAGNVLYEVNSWGFVTVRYIAPRIDPTLYKPVPRTFRPLTDPAYASALPDSVGELTALPAPARCAILPRKAEEVSPQVTEGACTLIPLDTS